VASDESPRQATASRREEKASGSLAPTLGELGGADPETRRRDGGRVGWCRCSRPCRCGLRTVRTVRTVSAWFPTRSRSPVVVLRELVLGLGLAHVREVFVLEWYWRGFCEERIFVADGNGVERRIRENGLCQRCWSCYIGA
jgi:hypothetical protein